MNIKRIIVGALETNCYILEKNNKCLIIDPGDEYKKIKKNIQFEIVGILVTHYHFDHIGSLKDFNNVFIYDINNLKEGKNSIGPFNLEVIYTPGHTKDSVTYYFCEEGAMFVGDFIFYESIGRTDLPTGSNEEMRKSISKLVKYYDHIDIYPGHGDKTNLEHEKRNNIYVSREL